VKIIKILLVDNDDEFVATLSDSLNNEGFLVVTCNDSTKAVSLALIEKPNLILMELFMKEMDGIDLCIELSKQRQLQNTMLVFLTSRNQEFEQIAAFDAGADDYVLKPTKPMVLKKRLNAIVRRTKGDLKLVDFPQVRGLRIDQEFYLAYVDEKKTELSKKEFEILALLFSSPRKIFSRKELYEKIWSNTMEPTSRPLDVLMHNLRNKIGEDYIKTINKVGYYLDTTVQENKLMR